MEHLSIPPISYRLQDEDIIINLGALEKKINAIALPSFFTRTVTLKIGENRTIKISQAKEEEIHEAIEALKQEFVTPKDRIEEMIQCGIIFKNYKKESDFDIQKTHLLFLAGPTVDNFSALFGKYPPKRSELETLKKEMDERISKKQPLTYEWFVLFHMRLSILATPEEKRSGWSGGFEDKYFKKLIENKDTWMSHDATAAARNSTAGFMPNGFNCQLEHPDYFIFPTSLGNLDIDQMNRLFATGIFPIGLSNNPLMVDGCLMYPDQFFRHDLVHMRNETIIGNYDITLNRACEIKDKVIEKIDTLRDKNLKQLFKMIFFIMTHELPNQIGKMDKYLTTDLKGQLQRPFNPWEKTLGSDFLYRNDWYKDHFPDPKSLGLDTMEELWASGLKAFDQLLIGHTPTTPLEKTNTPVKEVITMVLPANFCNTKREEVSLTQGELKSYNQIVSWINEGCPKKSKPQKELTHDLFKVLEIQGVLRFVTTIV